MEIRVTELRKPRIEAKLKVRKGKEELFETYMGNISQSGIFLETPKTIAKVGEKVELAIGFPSSKEKIGILGKVVRIVGPNQVGHTKGLGIEFLRIEAKKTLLFNRFLEELLNARGMGCRKSPRISTMITVEFTNPKEIGRCLTQDLGRGGMFIQTERDLALGQQVAVVLLNPYNDERITLEGEIVHVRKSLKPRDRMGYTDGVGVKFSNMTAPKADRINNFLKNLLVQRKRRSSKKG